MWGAGGGLPGDRQWMLLSLAMDKSNVWFGVILEVCGEVLRIIQGSRMEVWSWRAGFTLTSMGFCHSSQCRVAVVSEPGFG